jgi:hypothetical protein
VTTPSAWLVARVLASLGSTSASVSPPIAVTVEASIADGDALAARLAAGLEPLAPLVPASVDGPAASIRVTGELLDFHVGLALPAAHAATWSQCPCTHAELVAHVQRRLAHALRPRPAVPPPPRVITAPPPACPPRVVQASYRIGRVGRLGVVMVGLGSLALGAGTGMWLAASNAGDEQWSLRGDLRPRYLVPMVLGASVLTTGAMLLFFDRRPLRPSRLRAARP